MPLGADRYASRGDTLLFLGCVGLSVAAMSLPDNWRDPIAQGLRQTVLAPFLALQQQTELLSAARAHYDAVVAQRDSAALAATFLPELRSENGRLRSLLGLGTRLGWGYVPAEVLHQPEPTNPLAFVVSAGRQKGVRPLSAVVMEATWAAMQLGIDDSVLRQGLGKAHVARGRCAFRRPVRRTRCRRRPGGPPDPRAGRDGAALSQRARR